MSGRALDGSWLYVEIYAICIAFLILTLYWVIKSRESSAQIRWFKFTVEAFIVAFCLNFTWALLRTAGQDTLILLQYAVKSGFYLFVDLGAIAYCAYAESEIGSSFLFEKINAIIYMLPLTLVLLVPVTTYWNGHCFVIGPDGDYRHGSLFIFNFGILAAYTMFSGIRLLLKTRNEVEKAAKKQMVRISMFSVAFCAVWLLLIPLPQFPFICFGVTFILMDIYIGNTSEQILIDKLTRINNRQNLMTYIEQKIRSHENELYVLMMDVDHFKNINDTYGHLEGDNALVCVSNALKSSCKECDRHIYLARYGGDEFIAVMDNASDNDAKKLAELIAQKVNYFSAWSNAAYSLTITVGFAAYEKGMSANELIKKADDDLYRKKHART